MRPHPLGFSSMMKLFISVMSKNFSHSSIQVLPIEAHPGFWTMADSGKYITIFESNDVVEGSRSEIDLDGELLIVTRIEGQIYCFSAKCPHASGNLAMGNLYRGRIDCPIHNYRFDIPSGRILWPADEPYQLRRIITKEEAGKIYIKL